MFGDYDFLANMYGLSGAAGTRTLALLQQVYVILYLNTQGRHCCLWCLISSDQLKVPPHERGQIQTCTTEAIIEDHHKFLADGGDLKKAKFYNNAIGVPIFPSIPLIQVGEYYLFYAKSY